MRKIFSLAFIFAVAVGCTELNGEELMRGRATERPVSPMQLDFERLEAQKLYLTELFSTEYVSLDYKFERSPFVSVVEAHREAETENLKTANPIFLPKFEEFSLSGILSGDVGNIAVFNAGNDSYYLKTGDSYSSSRSKVLFIGSNYVKVRSSGKDVFGNTKTEIKDIKIDDNATME